MPKFYQIVYLQSISLYVKLAVVLSGKNAKTSDKMGTLQKPNLNKQLYVCNIKMLYTYIYRNV